MSKEYIRLENVTKKIKKSLVLDHISLSLEKNRVYGIQGTNGSGKTMLLRAISGLIKTEGTVVVDGIQIGTNSFPKDIGILIEMPGFLNEFTGKQNLELLALIQEGIEKQDIIDVLSMVGLDPEDPKKYGKYSLGMKQRLGIAQAILKKPELILLDEPTNAIDKTGVENLVDIIKNLKKEGCTLIITSHDAGFLHQVADVTYEIERGAIVCGD